MRIFYIVIFAIFLTSCSSAFTPEDARKMSIRTLCIDYLTHAPDTQGKYSDVHKNAKDELESRNFDLGQCTEFSIFAN